MSNQKRFMFPILGTALLAACMACGSAAAQDSAAARQGQQATHHTMADMDTDKDGRMSRSEFAAAHDGRNDEFAAHDGNGDGFITQAEMDAHHEGMEVGNGHKDNPTMTEGEPSQHH